MGEACEASAGSAARDACAGFAAASAVASLVKRTQERAIPVTLNPEKTWIWWVLGTAAVIGVGVAATIVITQTHGDPTPGTLAAGAGWGTTAFRMHF